MKATRPPKTIAKFEASAYIPARLADVVRVERGNDLAGRVMPCVRQGKPYG